MEKLAAFNLSFGINVLILIIMEDTHGAFYIGLQIKGQDKVLILIVMEDTHGGSC